MLRLETETGWWLITHPDHARLAAAIAEHWGNHLFVKPEPRTHVLHGIAVHDDGWAARDARPQITRQGKPSAFSSELVGKYSAFEEIDLIDYLAVRDRALRLVAEDNSYAALLVSMHTHNLLSERADRSTIAPDQLPLLDDFLAQQKELQRGLTDRIAQDAALSQEEKAPARILDHFHLLQATDNLSLLSCVNFGQPGSLLHALRCHDGSAVPVSIESAGERHFRLTPYPLDSSPLRFEVPARHVEGKEFKTAQELQEKYAATQVEMLPITISA